LFRPIHTQLRQCVITDAVTECYVIYPNSLCLIFCDLGTSKNWSPSHEFSCSTTERK